MRMHFLLDANLPRRTAGRIKAAEHDATDVRDLGMRSAADRDIANHARANQLALITRDFDFADIRNYPPAGFHGIVVWTAGHRDCRQREQRGRGISGSGGCARVAARPLGCRRARSLTTATGTAVMQPVAEAGAGLPETSGKAGCGLVRQGDGSAVSATPHRRRNGVRRHLSLSCGGGECGRIPPDKLLHAQRPLPS
jgi:predicted nuclease of predicted toxin-antitoxin system